MARELGGGGGSSRRGGADEGEEGGELEREDEEELQGRLVEATGRAAIARKQRNTTTNGWGSLGRS